MSDPWSLEAFTKMRYRVWATRDACFGHYPARCPEGCGNAGKHDAGLGDACECRECGFGQAAPRLPMHYLMPDGSDPGFTDWKADDE